ncbi:MAG: class I SAM-dependent methyltransferase [Thermoanaerobaculia bacterium]
MLQSVLETLAVTPPGRSLEVGCGDGSLLDLLPGALRVGVDQNLDDLRDASVTGGLGVAALCEALPFCSGGFSLIGAFDVLEHLKDEGTLLRQCRSLLAERGWLVATVPAGPELWSHLDEFAGHYRRYDRRTLCETVRRQGFEVLRILPLFRILWPLAWVSARWNRGRQVRSEEDSYKVRPSLNSLLRVLVRLEWRLLGRVRLGRGTSWLLVARAAAPSAGQAA